jgi:hypothetical protein
VTFLHAFTPRLQKKHYCSAQATIHTYFKLWIYHDAPVPVFHLLEWWEKGCPGCQEGQYPPRIKQPGVVSAFLSSYSKPSRQSSSQSVVVSTGFLLPGITQDDIYTSLPLPPPPPAGDTIGNNNMGLGYHQWKVAWRWRVGKEHFDVSVEAVGTKNSIKPGHLSSFDSQFYNSLRIS